MDLFRYILTSISLCKTFPGYFNQDNNLCIFYTKNKEWIRTIPHLLHDFSCNIKTISYHYNFNRFITSFTITSFSSGFDSVIINVVATKVPSLSLFSPSKNKALFLSKNSRNNDAAILLQPSTYGWSFIIKYNRFAAFSSKDWYASCPNTLW